MGHSPTQVTESYLHVADKQLAQQVNSIDIDFTIAQSNAFIDFKINTYYENFVRFNSASYNKKALDPLGVWRNW